MNKTHYLIGLLLCFCSALFAQLNITITEVPDNTPLADQIYLAGTVNNWNEADENFVLTNNGDQTYSISIDPAPGLVEFKFTRGSWASVEGNAAGGFQPNHQFNYSGTASDFELVILSWEDLGPSGNAPSTATENVLVLDQDFYMPQLNRNRRIWIYLPPDYNSSNKNYPVLYLQDGQNTFDQYTSFSGEWQIDESLNTLFDQGDEGAIVVAIDNGGVDRINEYSPWVHPTYGGGQGDLYVDFLVNTLKPHIDANYRTRPEREATGIVGSSMGGLIAMYAAIEHQEVFGKAGVFSPSFWFSDQAFSHVSTTGKEADMRIYLLAGIPEDNGSVVADLESMYQTLLNAGFDSSELNIQTHLDGQHSEWYWAREFPTAYQWLCANLSTAIEQVESPWNIRVFPNPANELLYIHYKHEAQSSNQTIRFTLRNLEGQKLLDRTTQENFIYIDTTQLQTGVYWIQFLSQEKVIQTEQLIIQH